MAPGDRAFHPQIAALSQDDRAGARWAALVARVKQRSPTDPLRIGLVLTFARHNRSQPPGSPPLDPACPVCSAWLLAEFEGDEQALLELFYRHVAEVKRTIKQMRGRRRERLAA